VWTEKYRPRRLAEVVGQDEAVRELRSYLAGRDPPNLLFHGPPGTGKTSTAIAFARDLLGDWFDEDFLEVNASDDRSLTALRSKVLAFAKLRPWNGLKVVFMDEADGLAPDAQDALRRPMEMYHGTTRWVFAANTADLSAALVSRCRTLRFGPVPPAEVARALRRVASAEEIPGAEALIARIAESCDGDVRRAMQDFRGSLEVSG
jgi:replication factor C small subunit